MVSSVALLATTYKQQEVKKSYAVGVHKPWSYVAGKVPLHIRLV